MSDNTQMNAVATKVRNVRTIKPTPRQRKLAKLLIQTRVSDKATSSAQILKNAGYGKDAQNVPSKVIGTAGVQQAIRELGLTEELITTSLINDIKNKPLMRVRELALGADILGMRKQVENTNGDVFKILQITIHPPA